MAGREEAVLTADPAPPTSPEEVRGRGRIWFYGAVALFLALLAVALRGFDSTTGPTFHLVQEALATVLALIVGALALVRFYSRKQGTFLFIGTGFLGAAVLDGYHAIGAAGLFGGGAFVDLTVWSWTASRVFLALFLFVSALAWRREQRGAGRVRELSVYVTAGALAIVIFAFFSIAELRSPYVSGFFFVRPAELIPGIFFGLTFTAYYQKGSWREDAFEHWLLVSLLVGVFLHVVFVAHADQLYGTMFDAGHVLKLLSYLAILTGLLVSVYETFRREARALQTIQSANQALADEVSVRREAERVLQESEERLQSFLDTAHDLIQSTDPNGRIVYANRVWKETLGYAPEEQELMLWDLLPPRREQEVRKTFDRLLAGEDVGRMLLELRARDGRTVLCSGSATVHRVDGEPDAVQGIFRDVTEQRRAERELAASRANLEALVENTGDAIWSVDQNHRLITFNSAFSLAIEARSGREPHRGDPPEAVFGTDQAAWYRELYQRALDGHRFSDLLEEEVQGERRAIEIYCNPISGEEGVTGAVMFGKDVTPRLRAEEALRIAKEEAEAANRAKSQFLASMSHELRTPLNSVIGFANILLKNKDGALAEKQLNFLDRILANGRHLLSLINEVLDLAKIESGRMELDVEEIDLAELVRETLGQLEGRVQERDVELVADVPDHELPIRTDEAKLKQVIINLVGNALKFTEEGSVTVRVETGGRGRPRAVHVVDTGIGIPEDRLDAIFEAFQQADGSTSRRFGGTGLGLAISRSICLLLGYDITVDSVVGEGSTFSIVMGEKPDVEHLAEHPGGRAAEEGGPEVEGGGRDDGGGREGPEAPPGKGLGDHAAGGVEAGEPPASSVTADSEAEDRSAAAAADFSVLVIDDEPESRLLLATQLRVLGCDVLEAGTAREGFELARERRPNLIALDLMMPDIDGWDALRRLKGDPELRDIPVVVVSVAAHDGDRERLLGAIDLLRKPADREDLLRILWRTREHARPGRVLVVEDEPTTRTLLERHLRSLGLEVAHVEDGREALDAVDRDAPDAVVLDLVLPEMDGMTFLAELRASPYYAGLPVVVLTAKDLSADERQMLGDLASGVVRKGEGMEERLDRILSALFSLRPSAEG